MENMYINGMPLWLCSTMQLECMNSSIKQSMEGKGRFEMVTLRNRTVVWLYSEMLFHQNLYASHYDNTIFGE